MRRPVQGKYGRCAVKLLHLSLRGSVGVERGLGLDQVEIDFSRYDAGVIAFTGPNGSSKTTLVENLTPFRTLVSRPGSLQNHCYLRDSHRILRFEMGGHVYEIKLLVDAQAGKQESYLFRDGEPLTDGKTTTYDAAVREIFGSEDLFFRSLFRGQNAESITELRASERKALFVELLGLAHIEAYHEAAKAKANGHLREVDDLRARIDTMREQAGDAASLRADLDTAEIELRLATEALDAARKAVTEAEAAERTAREALAAFDGLRTERDRLATKKREAEQKVHAADFEIDRQEQRHEDELEPLKARIERAEKILANTAQIDAKLAELKDLREWQAGHEEKRMRHDAAERKLADARGELASMEAHYSQSVRDAETVLADARRAAELAEQRFTRQKEGLEQKIAAATKAAALLGDVPCNGMDIAGTCKLLSGARQDRDSIAGFQAELDALASDPKWDEEGNAVLRADDELQRVRSADGKLAEQRENVEALELALGNVGYDAAAHAAVTEGIRALEAKQYERLRIEADTAAQTKADAEADIAAAESRQTMERENAQGALDAARREVDFYEGEIAKVDAKLAGESDARVNLRECEHALDKAQNARAGCEDSRVAADQEVTRIRTRLEAAEAAEAKIAELQQQLDEVTAVHSRWALLARATGKDGIQALELDAAGPNVSAIANQLLADTFGSEFQIAFETTRLSADGKKQIETFEIKVLAGGIEQTIENLSGGQRVWIEAAIAQAIAIYLRRKSSLDLRTSFLDEADGALDSGNAFKYLSMLRSAHALAGIHHTILITHRQELLAHIPQQIRLVPGVGIEYVN
jgi:exonuclease SbcC